MEALGATIVTGRFHVEGDMSAPAASGDGAVADQQRTVAAVVNRSLAERYWPDGDAVGRELHAERHILSIVGVVDDIRHFGLDSPEQFDAYLPYAPDGAFFPLLDVAVRSSGDSENLPTALRQAVWSVDPDLPVSPPQTMNDRISRSITTPKFYSVLLMSFAAVAFLLAAGGIASSMLYSVGQRQRELGIRLALGARRRNLMRMIVGKGLLLTTMGIGVGLTGAFALSRVLDSFVFEVSTTDPMTFVGVSLLLAAVAIVACYLPARKAAGADPLEVLRVE
jgi:putative ABC transport system permease protein